MRRFLTVLGVGGLVLAGVHLGGLVLDTVLSRIGLTFNERINLDNFDPP